MKIKKIGFFLLTLVILLSGGVFMKTEKANAYDCLYGSACSVATGCNWWGVGADSCSTPTHACTAGINIAPWPAAQHSVCLLDDIGADFCVGVAGCRSDGGAVNTTTYKYCTEGKCESLSGGAPIVDPSLNAQGIVCRVTEAETGEYPVSNYVQGVWDYDDDDNDGQCVKCNGAKELEVCGDKSGTYFNGVNCTVAGNGIFEFACGADSACDEVMGAGSSCTPGLACENGGNPNCTASDHCDVNGHCCIDPNVIDLVTGACMGTACNCGADGCCNGIGCIATGGDPDCDCVTDFGGTNCGIAGSCDVVAGSSQIANHNGFGVCCTGACAGGCMYSCSTGLCFLFLANAGIIIGEDCCDGTDCYECDSGFVWDGVLNACMPLGGGIPDMGHSTDHGNYFKYDKDVDLVFTEGAEFLLRIAGGLALFVLILGGVYYIISGSNPDGQTRAKKVVTYAVIGLAIVLVSYVIVVVVENIAV